MKNISLLILLVFITVSNLTSQEIIKEKIFSKGGHIKNGQLFTIEGKLFLMSEYRGWGADDGKDEYATAVEANRYQFIIQQYVDIINMSRPIFDSKKRLGNWADLKDIIVFKNNFVIAFSETINDSIKNKVIIIDLNGKLISESEHFNSEIKLYNTSDPNLFAVGLKEKEILFDINLTPKTLRKNTYAYSLSGGLSRDSILINEYAGDTVYGQDTINVRIQFIVCKKDSESHFDSILNNLEINNIIKIHEKDFTYYMVNSFKEYEEALMERDKLREKGFSDAFIGLYCNGKRIFTKKISDKNNLKYSKNKKLNIYKNKELNTNHSKDSILIVNDIGGCYDSQGPFEFEIKNKNYILGCHFDKDYHNDIINLFLVTGVHSVKKIGSYFLGEDGHNWVRDAIYFNNHIYAIFTSGEDSIKEKKGFTDEISGWEVDQFMWFVKIKIN